METQSPEPGRDDEPAAARATANSLTLQRWTASDYTLQQLTSLARFQLPPPSRMFGLFIRFMVVLRKKATIFAEFYRTSGTLLASGSTIRANHTRVRHLFTTGNRLSQAGY